MWHHAEIEVFGGTVCCHTVIQFYSVFSLWANHTSMTLILLNSLVKKARNYLYNLKCLKRFERIANFWIWLLVVRLNYSLCRNENPVELISHLFSQELEIKKMAKTGNKEACKVLAKQLVQLRKQKNRTYAVSSKVTSMSTQTKVMNSQMKMAGAMSATAKVRHLQDILSHSNAAKDCKNRVILCNCRDKNSLPQGVVRIQ